MLKYALYPSTITKGKNDHLAIPQGRINSTIEEIIHQITGPGSILKETECVAVIHDFFKAIAGNLKEGKGFMSEYIQIQTNISGVFEGKDDEFDTRRHKKKVNITASSLLLDAVQEIPMKKVSHNGMLPEVNIVVDVKTNTKDEMITRGHLVELHGKRLKLNLDQPDEGVFLLGQKGKKLIKINRIHLNSPGTLSIMIPDRLKAGVYYLEVRKRKRRNKKISVAHFQKELIVK